MFNWTNRIRDLRRIADGTYDVTFGENMVLSCGEGITYQPKTLEAWGPEKYPTNANPTSDGAPSAK